MRDSRADLRDVVLTLLLPPIGLLLVGRGLVIPDRRPRDVAHWVLAVALVLIGAWLTFVLLGLTMFGGGSVRTT